MERENINRGLGWLFMSIGRRLERAIYLTRMLRQITLPLGEQDWPLLECLLEVADSYDDLSDSVLHHTSANGRA